MLVVVSLVHSSLHFVCVFVIFFNAKGERSNFQKIWHDYTHTHTQEIQRRFVVFGLMFVVFNRSVSLFGMSPDRVALVG